MMETVTFILEILLFLSIWVGVGFCSIFLMIERFGNYQDYYFKSRRKARIKIIIASLGGFVTLILAIVFTLVMWLDE